MSGKQGQCSTRPTAVPAQYTELYLASMDGRTRTVRALRARYVALTQDLGGEAALSYQQRSLCKRVIHLESFIEGCEALLAAGEDVDMGKFVQALNGLNGLFRSLDLHRKPRDVGTLQDFVKNWEAEHDEI